VRVILLTMYLFVSELTSSRFSNRNIDNMKKTGTPIQRGENKGEAAKNNGMRSAAWKNMTESAETPLRPESEGLKPWASALAGCDVEIPSLAKQHLRFQPSSRRGQETNRGGFDLVQVQVVPILVQRQQWTFQEVSPDL
jgi:hypothetical protein